MAPSFIRVYTPEEENASQIRGTWSGMFIAHTPGVHICLVREITCTEGHTGGSRVILRYEMENLTQL